MVVQNTYHLLRINNLTPTAAQQPCMVVWLSGERFIAFWCVELAVQVNQRSLNLVKLSQLEQALRRDTVLQYITAPASWHTLFYHSQVR